MNDETAMTTSCPAGPGRSGIAGPSVRHSGLPFDSSFGFRPSSFSAPPIQKNMIGPA